MPESNVSDQYTEIRRLRFLLSLEERLVGLVEDSLPSVWTDGTQIITQCYTALEFVRQEIFNKTTKD